MTLSNTVWIFLVFVFLSRHSSTATAEEEFLLAPRIISGTLAAEEEFPFMAALMLRDYFICGASILSAEWILTAAHCVYRLPIQLLSVYVGTTIIDKTRGLNLTLSEIIIHRDYKHDDNVPNDIAVLKLKTGLQFSPLIQPIKLPYPMQEIEASTPVYIMGWGYTEYKENATSTKNLQKALLYVTNQDECDIVYYKDPSLMIRILPTHFCAGWPEGGIGQCFGDSGGPVVTEENGYYTQLGIVSFSAKPCAKKGYPGVFTSIPYYRHWIRHETGL